MLTIFATPKPFTGMASTHQTNAFESWSRIDPRLEIQVHGDETGLSGIANRLGFTHYRSEVELEGGVPLMSSLFSLAQAKAKNDLLMYTNSDIIVVKGLIPALEILDKEMPKFLGVCRRWDIPLDEPLDFDGDWRQDVETVIERSGKLHSECSSDIFLFRKGLWDLPPFTVGRPKWDNWVMWKATEQQCPVVDLTPFVTLAHSLHRWGPDQNMSVANYWGSDELAIRNSQFIVSKQQYCLSHVKEKGGLWELGPEGLVKL